jgi:hypothetical protein
LIAGTGVQTANLNRWGDYSSINTDPADDCKFWYTTEYLTANGTFNWHTRIGSFKFAGCGGPDNTNPTVSITSPANGANVNGTRAVNANASDDVGVTKVEFYADGNLIGTDTTAPYSTNWDTTTVSNGSHSLTGKAFDAANNTGTSSAVNVTVDNSVPITSITAPASGATVGGTTTVNADASDNVAVTNVEFYANATLIGSDTSSPYSINWNTTGFANGAYNLTSKAFDAAGNSGVSGAVPVTVSNTAAVCSTTQLLANPGFENGNVSWNSSPATGIIGTGTTAEPSHTGSFRARLGGKGVTNTSFIFQQIAIPANACDATFTFWLRVISSETTTALQNDKISIQILNSSNALLKTLGTFSNLNKSGVYSQKSFDLLSFKGQTIRIKYVATENASLKTSFLVDDASISVVSNGLGSCAVSQIFVNPGFESGNVDWNSSPLTGIIGTTTTTDPAHTGTFRSKLGGKGVVNTGSIFQQVSIPSNACIAKLMFFERITTAETTTSLANDKLQIQVLNPTGTLLQTLATHSNLNKTSGYVLRTFSVLSFKGQTIRIRFLGTENASLKTTFLLDDTSLKTGK